MSAIKANMAMFRSNLCHFQTKKVEIPDWRQMKEFLKGSLSVLDFDKFDFVLMALSTFQKCVNLFNSCSSYYLIPYAWF